MFVLDFCSDVKRLGLELPPALSKSKESMSMSPSGSGTSLFSHVARGQ